ncbi:MAG: PD-(D/E)XK nuclease family transposase [Bacilli bacterium]|nr:PD-(D/E)XK nuclease family transposase [Bacilli bacterium]
MTSHALKLKERLKPGEKVPLCFDECFKIMFGNEKHLEPLTFLISNILEVGYNEIEGKIALSPLRLPNDTIGEKKMERGILVTLKEEKQGKIILEVNVKKNFYETVINRNLNYLSEVASKGLKESDSYDDIIPTLLVNFNTFYVDNIHKKIFDEYYFRNEEGHILTENQKILNINIVECYSTWYNGTYKAPRKMYERELILLGAAMYTKEIKKFNKIIAELETNKKVKKIMEEVSTRMNENEILKVRYVDFLEENKKLNEAIIRDEKKKARREGLKEGKEEGIKEGLKTGLNEGIQQNKKEMVLNMLNKKLDISLIHEYTNIPINEIKEIIKEK